MVRYICNAMRCNTLIDHRGYCKEHEHIKAEREANRFASRDRSRSLNGPLANSYRWKKLREKILDRDEHICSYCRRAIATEVHHIEQAYGNEELFFDESNLVSVCKECHSRITLQQTNRVGVGRREEYR